MNIVQLLISEIIIAFLTGSLPLFIVSNANPKSKIISDLAKLNPGDSVVLYSLCMLMLHLIVWAFKKFFLESSQFTTNCLSWALKISHQVGFTIHSIYRVIAGAIPAAIVLLMYNYGVDIDAIKASLVSGILVAVSLFMCCFLTWLSDVTAPKTKFF